MSTKNSKNDSEKASFSEDPNSQNHSANANTHTMREQAHPDDGCACDCHSDSATSEKNPDPKVDKAVAEKDTLIADLTDLLKRKQAEFENYQKRSEANTIAQTKFASEKLVKKIVPIIENFNLAMKHRENPAECIIGLEMIQKQLHDVLVQEGLQTVPLVGQKFDPQYAEAMKIIHNEKSDDNVVVEEIQKCYKLHGQVIKYGKVIVSRIPKKTEESV